MTYITTFLPSLIKSLIALVVTTLIVFFFFSTSAHASEYPAGACFTTTERTTGYEVNIVIPPNVPICGSGGGCTTSPFPTTIATYVMTNQQTQVLDDLGVGSCGLGFSRTTASLNAVPAIVDAGNASVLSWSSQGASYCSSGDFETGNQTAGSTEDFPLSTTEYTVQCGLDPTNTATNTAFASATVTVRENVPAPVVSLSAVPNHINQGETLTLTWDSENATSCTGGGFSTGGNTNGSVDVSPGSSRSYSITCSGPGGDAYDEVYITVRHQGTPPTVSLVANPSTIDEGESTTLSWDSENAGSCTGGGFSTGGAVEGSVSVSPDNDVRYSISCRNSSGVAFDYADVIVDGGGTPGCVGPDCPCVGEDCGGGGGGGGNPSCPPGEECGVETNFAPSCTGSPAQGVEIGEPATWSANPRGTGYSYTWSGSESLSGTNALVQKVYSQPGLKNASVTVSRGSITHTAQCQNQIEVTAPPAIITFTPSKNPIVSGNPITLSWSAEQVTPGSCSIVGPGVNRGNLNAGTSGSGSVETENITSESSFTLRCLDLNGEQQSRVITVRVVPSFIEI